MACSIRAVQEHSTMKWGPESEAALAVLAQDEFVIISLEVHRLGAEGLEGMDREREPPQHCKSLATSNYFLLRMTSQPEPATLHTSFSTEDNERS